VSRARQLLLDAAQLIENNAEALKGASTVTVTVRDGPQLTRWDRGVREAYERETRIAERLRALAQEIG
jgi:hypothetical protein